MSNSIDKTRKVILVVDDVPANLALLLTHLRTLNFQVLVAESGMSAIEQIQHIRPDLILLDVMMPGLDGYETCKLIKSNPITEDIPVIFVSALADAVDKVRGFDVGGVDYVTKPIEINEVVARVNTHLLIHDLKAELSTKNAALEDALAFKNSELTTEMRLRRQSQQDKDVLFQVTQQQGYQLQSLIRSMLESGTDQNTLWHLLHRPVFEHLTKARELVSELVKDTTEISLAENERQEVLYQLQQVCTQVETEMLSLAPQMSALFQGHEKIALLSEREADILKRIANGENNEEIAITLSLASPTVRTYRTRIMRKLDIHHVAGLTKFAIQHGLIDMYS